VSTSGHSPSVATVALVLLLAEPATAGAQTPPTAADGPIDEWARAIVEATAPRWTGPRVEWAPSAPRPIDTIAAESLVAPLAVHADPRIPPERVERALAAMERAHRWLAEGGWGEPYDDGGRGGSGGLDLYLRADAIETVPGSFDRTRAAPGENDEVPARAIRVGYDAAVAWADLDAVTSFAEVDSRAAAGSLEACVIDATTQAIVAQQDPAEAPAWRRAIGGFVAWQLTGELGCAEGALAAAQSRPDRGLVGHAPGSGEEGALLLAAISARHDAGTGDFVRDLVQGARQWTWDGGLLRADPDIWLAISHFLEVSRDPLDRVVEELAIARFFTGSRAGLGAGALGAIVEAATATEVPIHGRAEWSGRMPRTLIHGDVELATLGSSYSLVDVRGAGDGARLRVWLRGEFGAHWSMVAVRLDDRGRELGRMRTPVRDEPRAYLPVELDARTASVLVVVTNIPRERPDADVPDENVRGFRLVVDRARDGE
jgi:hypothetical protein